MRLYRRTHLSLSYSDTADIRGEDNTFSSLYIRSTLRENSQVWPAKFSGSRSIASLALFFGATYLSPYEFTSDDESEADPENDKTPRDEKCFLLDLAGVKENGYT